MSPQEPFDAGGGEPGPPLAERLPDAPRRPAGGLAPPNGCDAEDDAEQWWPEAAADDEQQDRQGDEHGPAAAGYGVADGPR